MFEQDLKRGDTVVCIDDKIEPEMLLSVVNMFPNWIRENETYTVRGFYYNDGLVTGMVLEEIKNPPIYIDLIGRSQEPCFRCDRFIKVDQISISEKIAEEIQDKIPA